MRGVVMPEREEDFTADPVELFFDLAYVFAFSRLVWLLVHEPTWTGAGEFALLFAMVWLPWTQFTWSANAVSGNARPVRVLFLVATVTSIPMAGSVTAALDGDGAPVFAITVSIILAMGLFTMLTGLPPGSDVRAGLVRYSVPNTVAIIAMVVGAFFDREVRIGFWIAAMVVVVLGMMRAGSSEWVVRPGHFAERHGLIVIVALGEIIVAIGLPVVDNLQEGEGLAGRTVAALIAAGIFAGLMWWSYFDRPNPALEHRHHGILEASSSARFARDVYTLAHIPVVAGVILTAAALEEVTLHPSEELARPFRWMLITGLVLYLSGIGIAVYRAFGVFAKERIVGGALLTVVVALGGSMRGLTLLIIVDLILLAVLVLEHIRIEHPRRPQRHADVLAGTESG